MRRELSTHAHPLRMCMHTHYLSGAQCLGSERPVSRSSTRGRQEQQQRSGGVPAGMSCSHRAWPWPHGSCDLWICTEPREAARACCLATDEVRCRRWNSVATLIEPQQGRFHGSRNSHLLRLRPVLYHTNLIYREPGRLTGSPWPLEPSRPQSECRGATSRQDICDGV
jgi:hypothetical protein